jgi:uncharacterized protein YbaP (TraB family)
MCGKKHTFTSLLKLTMFKWIFGLLIGFSSVAQTVQSDNELLWEISGNGLKLKSYLFGSLHSNDRRLFQLSDSTYYALDHTQSIVLETSIFSLFEKWDTRREEVKVLYDNQGKPYTGSDKASKTLYGNEDGMPQFLDAYFMEYCYNSGKQFYALESIDDQLDLIADWAKPSSDLLSYTSTAFTQEKMIEFYLKGDIASLDKMMRANLSVNPGMFDEVIVNRNKIMLKGIDSLLRKQSLFCAIGAGHLSGENGVINLLRKKGYKLRRVTASFSEEPTKEKVNVRSSRNYYYTNDTLGIVAVFPGKPQELKIWDNHPYLIYREMGQGNTYSIEIVPIDGSTSLEEQAAIYIASPSASQYEHLMLDDGSEVYQGLSDTYPEGLHWIRLLQNDQYLLILKAYGGNKFMNSNRPNLFFSKVWFE